ncbi:hypothetical protein CANCADRAFT_68074 [Tortispora caseinolytica NRRL Y-17796]|uniref:PA14 domain-containing protein n=1 Tax=Tortispora caseinolytica NRRL Y-17796 TaxID=767744 RepID=A0A1E4TE84_9ASCO|nr:hypothetical protein CANCADRAFT_68074 [Tortispora caseinolytica NRRL Y-17796]
MPAPTPTVVTGTITDPSATPLGTTMAVNSVSDPPPRIRHSFLSESVTRGCVKYGEYVTASNPSAISSASASSTLNSVSVAVPKVLENQTDSMSSAVHISNAVLSSDVQPSSSMIASSSNPASSSNSASSSIVVPSSNPTSSNNLVSSKPAVDIGSSSSTAPSSSFVAKSGSFESTSSSFNLAYTTKLIRKVINSFNLAYTTKLIRKVSTIYGIEVGGWHNPTLQFTGHCVMPTSGRYEVFSTADDAMAIFIGDAGISNV